MERRTVFRYHAVNRFIFIFSDANLAQFPWALNCCHVWSVSVLMWEKERKRERAISYLSNHPVPDATNHLAVLPVGDQIKVIWKFDGARELLQDVYAETFAAEFGVRLGVTCDTVREKNSLTFTSINFSKKQTSNKHFAKRIKAYSVW